MLNDYFVLIRKYWPMLSFGLLTIFFGNFGQSFFISWYGSSIQESLNLSATHYGSLYSGATLASAVCILWLGGAVDKIALRVFILLVASGLLASTLLIWQSQSVWLMLIAIFLLRFCGQGLLPHTAMTTMGRYFSLNRGKAISIASNGMPLGEVILPALAVWLISTVGWQNSWLVIALMIAVIYLPSAFWLLHQAGPSESSTEQSTNPSKKITKDANRKVVLQDYRYWCTLPSLLIAPFAITGLFIHQGFFLSEKSWSAILFANTFIVYGITHWFSSMFTGALVDKYSATRLLKTIGLPYILSFGLAAFFDGAWVAYMMMAILGIGVGMIGPIANALWAEVYGSTHLGSIRSLNTAFMVFSTASSPILLGFLIDAEASGKTLLLLLCAYAVIASLINLVSYQNTVHH